MDKNLDYDTIAKLYENSRDIWPIRNNWYNYTKKKIKYFINKYIQNGYILNAGSGGNTYGLNYKMCHVDIVKKNICKYDDYEVASIEKLPFTDSVFDSIICVGDVINYCEAEKAIKEFNRVIKKRGRMIIEYENSNAFEYANKEFYGRDKVITNLEYLGETTNQYLYSYKYMEELLRMSGFDIQRELSMHIISGLVSNWIPFDNISCTFAILDRIFNQFSCFKKHGSNILYLCEKIDDV